MLQKFSRNFNFFARPADKLKYYNNLIKELGE